MKPNVKEYDTAFVHLTKNFKIKNLKHLICSPMRCVPDNISIQHFAANIFKFQETTAANVCLVTYNEDPTRCLKNGLKYSEFFSQLEKVFTNRDLEQQQSVSILSDVNQDLPDLTAESSIILLTPGASGEIPNVSIDALCESDVSSKIKTPSKRLLLSINKAGEPTDPTQDFLKDQTKKLISFLFC